MSTYKILSFDPGLSTLGWANCSFDTDTNKFTVHRFGNFKATKVANKEKEQSSIYGYRLIALNFLEDEIKRLIDFFKPDYLASEDVFLHIRHVNAFAALTLCMHTMRKAAFMKNKVIYTMAPCDIKKDTAGNGHADKDAIQKAVLENPNIVIEENKMSPVDKMCEHEADAIAVGYAFSQSLLPALIMNIDLIGEYKFVKKPRKERTKKIKIEDQTPTVEKSDDSNKIKNKRKEYSKSSKAKEKEQTDAV